MRLDGGVAQPALFVLFVVGEVAFKPFDVAVAFEREDMSCEPIEEEAIMRNDHGAAGKILERCLQRAVRSRHTSVDKS